MLHSLSENRLFIKLISRIAVYFILAFIVLGCLDILLPSQFGAAGEWTGAKLSAIATDSWNNTGLKVLCLYLFAFTVDAYCLGFEKSAIKSVLNPDKTTKTDIIIFVLEILGIWRYLTMLSFFMIGYFINKNFLTQVDSNLLQVVPSYLAQTIIFFLVVDFLGYWQHRFGHRVSWWWSVHRLHHSAEKFNIITVARTHPLDLALKGVFIGIPVGLLGTPLETFIVLELIKMVHGKFLHSMLNWNLGSLGKYVLMSPVAHRVHHSPDPIHWDKNYGQVLVIWDRMFGTWYDGKEINTTIGLWGQSTNQNGLFFEVAQAQLQFIALFFSTWKVDVGVLKPERKTILSELYRKNSRPDEKPLPTVKKTLHNSPPDTTANSVEHLTAQKTQLS